LLLLSAVAILPLLLLPLALISFSGFLLLVTLHLPHQSGGAALLNLLMDFGLIFRILAFPPAFTSQSAGSCC
jgi:hypothetical protein